MKLKKKLTITIKIKMKDPPTISIACTVRAPTTSQSHAASCKLLPKTFLPSFVIRETSSKSNRMNVVTDCFTNLRTKKTDSLLHTFEIKNQFSVLFIQNHEAKIRNDIFIWFLSKQKNCFWNVIMTWRVMIRTSEKFFKKVIF